MRLILQGAKYAFGVVLLVFALNNGVACAVSPEVKAQIRAVIDTTLRARYPDLAYSFQFDILNEANLKFHQYKGVISVKPGQSVVGAFSLPVRYVDNRGQSVGVDQIQLRLRLFADQWVAMKSIQSGSELNMHNVATRNIEVNDDSLDSVKLKLKPSEYSARREIAKGQVLRTWMIGPKVVVHAGDRLTLRVVADNVRVEVVGVALEDGAIGEMIRVKSLDYQKTVTAIVEDARHATADL